MAAPYWGELPVGRDAQPRPQRASEHSGPATNRRQSLDAAAQPPQRGNRSSVQTTYTDAPTESTRSPFASPTASTFDDRGLAPRPPTLPYGSNQYPPEIADRRQRRRSRNQEEDIAAYGGAAAGDAPPPAAPEVPRGPPSSFRHPYGNGGLPFTVAAGAGGPPNMQRNDRRSQPGAGEYFKGPSPEDKRYSGLPPLDRSRQKLDTNPNGRHRSAGYEQTQPQPGAVPANGMAPGAAGSSPSHQRRASQGDPSGRRKKFADDRSPLQRLEGTLTKEEKRARVEAAEKLVRQRENKDPAEKATTQQVRFQDPDHGPLSDPGEKNVRMPLEPIGGKQESASHGGPLTQNPPEEGAYGPGHSKAPRSQPQESRIPVPSGTQASGIPKRNLSFRERAAKNELDLPQGNEVQRGSDTLPPTNTSSRSLSLTRNGSNKLRKDPPGDPWFNRRLDAEKQFGQVQPRGDPTAGRVERGGPIPRRAGEGQMQQQDLGSNLPRLIPGNTAAPAYAEAQRPGSSRISQAVGQRGGPPQNPGRAAPPENNHSREVVAGGAALGAAAVITNRRDGRGDTNARAQPHHHHVSNMVYHSREKFQPGQGMYTPPRYLDEWRKATVGTLSGALLDLSDEPPPPVQEPDSNKPWWETPPSQRRRSSAASRPRKAEAFDGEYDETHAPTRFKPPLFLKCGPLLRYCGIRHERAAARPGRDGAVTEKDIWRGSIMIVTQDAESSYDIAPTLRIFLQPLELLPPPPHEVQGSLPPEYVDPIAGYPKLGRKGETLYVRPVEHLEEGHDVSLDETDEGLFEKTKSPPDETLPEGVTDLPGSFAARRKRTIVDGEKVSKYKDVRGFRLHSERGCTFWRFNIEVELRDKEQRIAYRINRGPATGFWVPAKGECMNIMFHSCNGFSLSVDPNEFSGPDPMWRDVLNNHQTRPFHVMVGGGDQIYNDAVMKQTRIFADWLTIKNPLHKHNAPFTAELQEELESFYLERYCMWFSQGLFGLANSQIPMVNMFDDHDIIDGFGSYPHHFMSSPVFSGLGNVAFKYYMLFQHQSISDETEASEPSWTVGVRPGPYIHEQSRSLFLSLGGKVALLAVDARTERTREEVIRDDTWKKLMDRCYAEIVKGKTEHLLVLLGVPVAYPRLVWLENILTSRLMDPVKALGKLGMFGKLLNKFDGGVEVLDDLDDHWTAKNHKQERTLVIEDLQDLAADKSLRITILSGDVHLAAVGQFYSNAKLNIAKHKDFRYMPNVISSAIVNTPPPDLMADVLNKRNKVHHFDRDTDEDMIPVFTHGVDGKPRNNKRLLPHRNWCSIREYVPGNTPVPSPTQSAVDITPMGTPPGANKGGIMRRLSKQRRAAPQPSYQPDASRPPASGGLFRSFSRSRRASVSDSRLPERPVPPKRTLSLSGGDFRPGNLFRRLSSRGKRRTDDGGINGQWGVDSEEEADAEPLPPAAARRLGLPTQAGGARGPAPRRPVRNQYGDLEVDDDDDDEYGETDHVYVRGDHRQQPQQPQHQRQHQHQHQHQHHQQDAYGDEYRRGMALRGGGRPSYDNNEFAAGDDGYFTAQAPRRAHTLPAPPPPAHQQHQRGEEAYYNEKEEDDDDDDDAESFRPRPFHRTPTGLSVKQLKKAEQYEVDLEGGLDIALNVEVSPKDPAGITVPYRLLVPKLWYEYEHEDGEEEGLGHGHGHGHGHGEGVVAGQHPPQHAPLQQLQHPPKQGQYQYHQQGQHQDEYQDEYDDPYYDPPPQQGGGGIMKRLLSLNRGKGRN